MAHEQLQAYNDVGMSEGLEVHHGQISLRRRRHLLHHNINENKYVKVPRIKLGSKPVRILEYIQYMHMIALNTIYVYIQNDFIHK